MIRLVVAISVLAASLVWAADAGVAPGPQLLPGRAVWRVGLSANEIAVLAGLPIEASS